MERQGLTQAVLLLVLVMGVSTLYLLGRLEGRTVLSEPVELEITAMEETCVTIGPVGYPCPHVPGGEIPVEAKGPDAETAGQEFRKAWKEAEELCAWLRDNTPKPQRTEQSAGEASD